MSAYSSAENVNWLEVAGVVYIATPASSLYSSQWTCPQKTACTRSAIDLWRVEINADGSEWGESKYAPTAIGG